ncbi:hypothetical protein Taro_005818, partial [Colocasia esculenta]|nr:hypothetical protein [Colocasia esculenta]
YTAETTPLEVLTLHRYDAARNWTSDERPETTPLEVLTLHRYDAARNWTSDERRPPCSHLWG